MPDVAVVTDTTHYLPRETVAELGVGEVSLYVNDGERTEREADIVDLVAFYEALRAADTLPTTSQPSIGDFMAVYDPLVRDGRDIVSIHLSGGISGTVEAARQAAAELAGSGARIEVIDTKLACGALGMVVLAASAAARGGADVDAVAARTREASGATRLWFAVDTLEYLQRGGRIGAAQAWLGGALKIKPILTFDGEIVPIERVRTAGRAFERMVHYLRSRHDDGADGWVIQHIQDEETASALAEDCREIFGCEPVFISEVGAVLGAHVGPGLLGVGSVPTGLVEPS
jgi:DegV family protein with EDD domain